MDRNMCKIQRLSHYVSYGTLISSKEANKAESYY